MHQSNFFLKTAWQFFQKELSSGFVCFKNSGILLFFIFTIQFFSIKTSNAQNTIGFEASVDKQKVALNDYVEISFSVRNAQPDAFQPPPFNDFKIAGGPNQSSEMSVMNGAVSRNVTYSFYLAPKNVGIFTIPAATMRFRGKEFRTQPIAVEVVKANTKLSHNAAPNPFTGFPASPPNTPKTKSKTALSDAQLAKGIFIKAVPNKREVFVGEQITVEYKLYTRYGLSGKQFIKLPELKGFFPVEFKQFDSNTRRENIAGVSYAVQTLRKVALYAQQEGALTIDELGVQVDILTDAPEDPFNDPFFGAVQSVRPYEVLSAPVSVNVRNLPSDPSKKFNGAVGAYAMQAVVVPTNVTTDDAITMTLTVTGNGDLKRIGMPNIGLTDSTAFEVYEPKITDLSEETPNDITGQKRYEITFIPRKVGIFSLTPSFTYFDTQLKQYKTLVPKTFELNIAKGIKPIIAYNPLDTTQEKTREVRLLRPQHNTLYIGSAQNTLLGSTLFWLFMLLPFGAVAAMLTYKRFDMARANIDTTLLRQQKAKTMAQQHLAKAQKCHENNDSLGFYNELQKALLGYLGDKFNIGKADLNKPFLKNFLLSQNTNPALINDLIQILETCEIAVFGGAAMQNDAYRNTIYTKTLEIIKEIEADVKKIL
jgi:BatD DUF11 like domain